VILTFLCMWGILFAVPGFTMDVRLLLETVLNLLPGTLLILAVTIVLGALFRRKNVAIAVVSAVIVGSYFIDIVGQSAKDSPAGALRAISFYSYYDSGHVIRSGLNWPNVVVLVAASAVCMAVGLWLF